MFGAVERRISKPLNNRVNVDCLDGTVLFGSISTKGLINLYRKIPYGSNGDVSLEERRNQIREIEKRINPAGVFTAHLTLFPDPFYLSFAVHRLDNINLALEYPGIDELYPEGTAEFFYQRGHHQGLFLINGESTNLTITPVIQDTRLGDTIVSSQLNPRHVRNLLGYTINSLNTMLTLGFPEPKTE